MSKIRLHGSSSGHTDVAPAAAAGNNTVTLPNSAGTLLLTDGSAASLTSIPAANIVGVATAGFGNASGAFGQTGQGITVHDVWSLTAGLDPAGGSNDITANWARSNSYYGTIGSAMAESSGIFTFPSTGIYFVQIYGTFFRNGESSHNYTGFNILTTTNNSGYASQQGEYSSIAAQSGNTYSFAVVSYTFDVTNTSTHKVKFQTVVEGSGTSINTGPNSRRLNVFFTRLGDT